MFNRQKSFRLIITAIALVAITALTFAYTSGSFNFTDSGKVSAESPNFVSSQALAPQTTVLSDDFEGATTFVFANSAGSVNDWFIGTATSNGGTKAAYITNDAGTTNAYTNSDDETATHMYAPITVPAGETAIVLSFDWKGVGEHSTSNNTGNGTSWDFVRVSLTTAAPVGGTMTAIADQLPIILNAQANYNRAYVVLPASIAGAGVRNLVFTWRDDTSGGSTAPAIDNVTVTSQVPVPLGGTKSIPGNYASIGAAIADVSANGADTSAGNLTFNVTAGQTFNETPPIMTASGSATGRIIFQKSGAGTNPKIVATGTSNTGATGSGTITTSSDGIIILNGADYVTFDGIDLEGGALVGTTATTTAQEYGYLIRNASATNGAQNNIFQNTSVTLHRVNTSSIGILQTAASALGGGVAPTATTGANSNNKYYNLSLQNMYTGIYFLGTAAFPDDLNEIGVTGAVTQNTIGAATANDIGNGSALTWGIRTFAQSNVKIFRNEIRNVTGTSTAAVDGIFMENTGGSAVSVGTNEIYRNNIHDIKSTSTSTTSHVVSGIRSNLSGNAASISRIYNNFVYDITNASTNVSSRQIIGIRLQDGGTGATATHNVHNNSVRLSPAGILCQNSGVEVATSTTGPVMNIRNNILANFTAAQAGSAKHYAIAASSASSFGNTGSDSNFNVLYIDNATNGFVGASGGTDRITLTDWQGAYTPNLDLNSINSNPLFAGTTDLHVTGASPALNIGATIATVTDDIDGEARPNGAAYEIGADEFYASPGVLQLSSTTYGGSEGGTANATVNRVSGSSGTVGVTYTLADGTGAVGGAACTAGVDYINPGPQLLSFGDSVTSQPIAVTLCSDAVLDPGETFTITLSAPTGGATLGTPTVATVTITDVPPPFSGSYNVGTAQSYTSLTNTGGIFEAINGAGAAGNITINITSDLTGETGTVALNQIAGGFTVLIKPSGAPRSITGSNSGALIRLNGADGVRIDGSTAASRDEETVNNAVGGNPALRELTITNSNTGTSSAVIGVISLGVGLGATNNTIQNTNLVGTTLTATNGTLFGIFAGSSTIGITSNGADNDTNTYTNNSITKSQYGIYSGGESIGNKNTGTVISENQMNAASPNNLNTGGIFLRFENGASITQNDISVVRHDGTTGQTVTAFGIALGVVPNNSTTTFTGSDVTGATVTRNKINGVTQMHATGYSSFGVVVNSVTSGTTTLANNMISGVRSAATPSDFSAGIVAGGGSGSTTNIYHNSVAMTGTRGAATNPSYGLAINSGDPIVDVRNNIFYNTQTSSSTGKMYAIGTGGATFANLTSDYNDFYVSGASAFVGQTGGLGTAGTDRLDLAAWQAATVKDANSQSVDPVFVDPTSNLHLAGTTPLLDDDLFGFAAIDFDGDPRENPGDIGADELLSQSGGSGTYYNASLGDGEVLGGPATVTNTLTLGGIVDTTGNTLTLGCNATVVGAGATNYVVGNVEKQFCTTGMFTYPVGTAADNMLVGNPPEYSPVIVNVTALGTNPSSLTISVTDTWLTGVVQASGVSRFWTVTETGDLTADMTFQYLDQDINGSEAAYKPFRRESTVTTEYSPNSNNPPANQVTALGVFNFSQWGIGALVPTAAHVNVGGRVMSADGMQGLPRVKVILSGGNLPQPVERMTNPFGYYSFEDLEVGQTYVITVGSKQYTFNTPTRVITPDDNIFNIDFFADAQ